MNFKEARWSHFLYAHPRC